MNRNPRKKSQSGPFAFASGGDRVVKRLTYAGNLATGGGTSIAITSYTSGQVQSLPASEWASFAARYQQYRVRAIRVTGRAVQPSQTATITHGILYRGEYDNGAVPATVAAVVSDGGMKSNATHKDFVSTITWRGTPNAKLWNPTSAIVPTANQFAFVCASAASPALTTATNYYAVVVEWEVEFQGSQ